MSNLLSARLSAETEARLEKLARRLGKTASETGALLIEQSLRAAEFAYIEFRNTSVSRIACMKNSNLAVWQVIKIARLYDRDIPATAKHLNKPTEWVKAAFNYAAAYPDEIEMAIENNNASDYTRLKKVLPQTELVSIPAQIQAKDSEILGGKSFYTGWHNFA